MSFVISFVLACTAILATFMLQLCDDAPRSSGSIISGVTFFAIIFALYFVDYKKKFSISKLVCNILIVLALFAQLGTLFQSRNDFLAYSIANVLSSLQAILFFQRKTLRKSYQILAISFVAVAVGCVFQRSALFVAALPVYSILAFACISLLFLWSERKFYAERVVLKNSFSGNRTLTMISEEEKTPKELELSQDKIDGSLAYRYGQKATIADETHFFRRPTTLPIKFEFEYFRRFLVGALGASFFASLFFCLFPRLDQIGVGQIQFEAVSWQSVGSGRSTKTGFKPSIELGDLGPSVDSHDPVMEVKFVDALDPKNERPLVSVSPVYFRGIALANYHDHIWADVKTSIAYLNAKDLCNAVRNRSEIDPESVLPPEVLKADRVVEERIVNDYPQPSSTPSWKASPRQNSQFSSLNLEGRKSIENDFFTKLTFFRQPPATLPRNLGVDLLDRPDEEITSRLKDFCSQHKSLFQFDTRSQLINTQIKLYRLDTPIVFTTNPFFVVKNTAPVGNNRSMSVQISSEEGQKAPSNTFWFLTPTFYDGRQLELVPNQERTLPYLDQYLELNSQDFPGLIATAKRWDAQSNLPKDDFVSRARYIASRLRDTGEFKYNRSGVLRNPDVDPLEDFIVENKEGHCEYFAGALTLLLRAIGIPARVVVGYACYPSETSATTVVRQSDAHSWVEAYIPSDKLPKKDSSSANLFPATASEDSTITYLSPDTKSWINDGAWLRLDATPSADRDAERPGLLTLGIYNWSYFFKSFGSDFIMNFNGARQMQNIYRPIVALWTSVISGIKEIKKNFNFIGVFFRRSIETLTSFIRGEWTPEIVVRFFVLLISASALVYVFWNVVIKLGMQFKNTLQRAQDLKRQREAQKPRDEVSAEFYKRLERSLEERLGTKRSRSETQREFLLRCFRLEDETLHSLVSLPSAQTEPSKVAFIQTSRQNRLVLKELIERFYKAQFGETPLTEEEIKRWTEVLRQIEVV